MFAAARVIEEPGHARAPKRDNNEKEAKPKPHPKLAPDLVRPGAALMPFESPNARSKSITVADGPNTGGALNQHPSFSSAFTVGVAEDKGTRRTMEDSHSFVVDFDDIRGQGYFGLFDGHAGKHAAEWCGQHFHEYLLDVLHNNPNTKIPNLLNDTFHAVDNQLYQMAQENKTHSGCTAVTAFLRIEDGSAGQSFLHATPVLTDEPMEDPDVTGGTDGGSPKHSKEGSVVNGSVSGTSAGTTNHPNPANPSPSPSGRTTPSSGSKIRNAVRSITSKLSTGSRSQDGINAPIVRGSKTAPFEPNWYAEGTGSQSSGNSSAGLRKVLYVANAGDARAVLSRAGDALRLTYDHKGSDAQESKRITDAGGFVMNNRVNGVLAVTRSLGDSAMKDFVVGSPYTTETHLGEHDEFIIIACDGLWDVTEDQEAVDLVRGIPDAQQMAKVLLEHALAKFSSDNVTVMVVRFKAVPKANVKP